MFFFSCSFPYIRFSKAQSDKKTVWMRRRGHGAGILALAQPVAGPGDPGLERDNVQHPK